MAEPDETPRPSGSGILDPLIGAGFFSPNLSLEEIKRRRAIAGALASRARPFPKTIGEGMTYFGESIADAINDYTLGRGERAYNERFEKESAPVREGLVSEVAPPPGLVAPPPVAAGPLVTQNASMDMGAAGAAGATGETVFDGPNPPIITNEIRPMQMAQAGPPAAPMRPSAMPGGTLAPVIPRDPGPMPQPSVRNEAMTKAERDAWILWQKNPGEPRAQRYYERAHEAGQKERDAVWNRQQKIDEIKLREWERQKKASEDATTSAPATQLDYDKKAADVTAAQAKEMHRRTYGDLPEPVSKVLEAGKEKAATSVNALEAVRDARQALPHAVFGFGADAKLFGYRAAAAAGNKDAQRVVEASQTFQSNMGPLIQQLVKGLAGKDVSKQELEFIRSIAGGNLALDKTSAERIINIAERTSNANLKEHQDAFDMLTRGQHPDALPALRSIYGVRAPQEAVPLSSTGAPSTEAPRVFASEAEAASARLPRGTPVIINGRRGRID